MKVTVIPTVNGALGTIPKNFVRELEELKIENELNTLLIRPI